MAERKLRYSIGIDVDSKNLLAQVNAAVNALKKLSTSSNSQISSEMQIAAKAALELSNNLQHAFNQETRKFDLANFYNQLKQSNTSISEYANRLKLAGEAGESAFRKVAYAITSAELPLMRSNKLLDSLWITMKNTARWQLTSSALRGFIGSIQTAYGYARDLNESLNRIQIVTGKNTEEMARFAKQANEAAKALSTTTTKYTDSSLTYFQQGKLKSIIKRKS